MAYCEQSSSKLIAELGVKTVTWICLAEIMLFFGRGVTLMCSNVHFYSVYSFKIYSRLTHQLFYGFGECLALKSACTHDFFKCKPTIILVP